MSKFLSKYQAYQTEEEKDIFLKKGINKVLDSDLRNELEYDLKNKYGVQRNQARVRRIRFRYIIPIAASIIFIVLTLFLIDQPSAYELANKFQADTIEHPGLTKGTDTENQQVRTEAIDLFNRQNFNEAFQQFQTLTSPQEQDVYFTGVSALKSEKYNEAINRFNALMDDDQSVYYEEARWFLVLSYILNGQDSLALDLLKEFELGSWNYDKAEKLIKKLEN